MSKKKTDKVTVRCVGMSSTDVTGSGYLVECPTGEKVLLDLGIYQSSKPYEDYKINKRKFDFKSSEITAVIISHINADHYCLLPKFVHEGGNCNIYISSETVDFVKPMLEDSAKILERDVQAFERKFKREHKPVYTFEDVENTLPLFRGCTKNEIHYISENVWFKLIDAGHIFGSCQIELYIKLPSGIVRKICYSGDLGNTLFEQPFVEPMQNIIKCNMFIGETTYNDPKRSVKKGQREKDIEVIKNVITQTCIDKKGIVLIPTFALQRTETMLYTLWNIFKDDKDFNIPIIVDSPLAVNLLDCFNNNLIGEWKEKFDEMMSWKNIKIIRTVEESMTCVADDSPKIVCSSSGMLTQGRSILYLKKILPRSNCAILTCGYMAEGGIGWKIKNCPTQKTITIDQKAYANRCDIKCLDSFSSHMQYEQLMNYYTNLANNGCDVIWLVHGDKRKNEFKKELEEKISKICKTTKIVATNRDTVARI